MRVSEDLPPPRPETGGQPPPPSGRPRPQPPPPPTADEYWVSVPSGWQGQPPPSGRPQPLPPPPGKPADPVGLRPRDVGGILDAAIRLYRSHWKGLMGIVSVLLVPATFILAAITATGSVAGTVAATVIDYLVVTPLLGAAVVKAGADVYLGDPISVSGTYRFVWDKAWRLVGLVLLVVAFFGVPVAITAAVAVAGIVPLAIALGIAFVVLAVLFGVRWYFAATTIVLEDRGVIGSLTRSWGLSDGHFWKMVGTLLLAGILVAIVSTIVSTPFAVPFFLDILSGGDGTGLFGLFVQTIGSTIAAIITQPFMSLVGVLLYFDLRIRDEGFDLEVMARELRGA